MKMQSPYLVTRHEIYVSDDIYYQDLQKKVLFRAAKLPAKTSRWDYAITFAFWVVLGCAIYWLEQLGFWDWVRGMFR